MMNSKKIFCAALIGWLGISAAGLASADVLSEYGSLASWDAAVSNVSNYQITEVPGGIGYGGPQKGEVLGSQSATIGPGTFTANTGSAWIYNDGAYGAGIEYFSDDPRAMGQPNVDGSVTVAFSAADDISALAFDVGAILVSDDIDVSVNGSLLAPAAVSPTFPTSFVGVTDTAGPITSVTFTDADKVGEMDVIGGYATASASPTAAPEFSPTSAPAALTLLIGLLVVLRGRRRSAGHTA